MKARTAKLQDTFNTFWAARNRREQNMLAAAAVVVVLGLLYALLIDPAVSGRADLASKLPGLRQQSAEVQALAKEVAAQPNASAAAAPPPMTRETVEAALTRQGLKAQNVSVTGELARVQMNGVSFTATVEWLTEMQRVARVSVSEATIEGGAQPDTVNATITLRQPRGGQG